LLDVVVNRRCDLLPCMYKDFLGLGMRDVLRNFQPDNVVRHVPENLFPFDRQAVGLVKGADDLFITLEAKSTQKDGREKLPFPVDSDIEDVLRRFVLELYPGAAIRNDLAQVVTLAWSRFEEGAGTTVQL